MLRKFEPGDRTYVNWCGVPVTVVGYDGPRVLARSQRAEIYVGTVAGPRMLEAASGGQPSGLFDAVSRDGIDIEDAFQRSTPTPCIIGVGLTLFISFSARWSPAASLAPCSNSALPRQHSPAATRYPCRPAI